MTAKKLTNSTGTSSESFSIDDMVIEYIHDGINDGAKISLPGYSPIYLRAINPNIASKWLNGTQNPLSGVGTNSDYFINTYSGDIFFKMSNLWTYIGSLKGPQGVPGSNGVAGPTGPTGPQGPAGPSMAAISTAADVQVTSLEDGDLLVWSASVGKFVNTEKELLVDGGSF